MIKKLDIKGFRGFGEHVKIEFSIPDDKTIGSGLTIITGANNAGKTTIIEALRAFNSEESPSFSEGRRNKQASGKVTLKITDDKEQISTIKSTENGGSSTEKIGNKISPSYILQSRRAIPFEFCKSQWNRQQFIIYGQGLESHRTSSLNNFEARIFQIEKGKKKFDVLIQEILGKDFQWAVELRDSGNYYIKYTKDGIAHSSEGIGDGIWSIFTICAALFDAPEKSTIVIDEPELSLHPALQRRLMDLLMKYAKAHQIIISTHSPYFIDWQAIINGAQFIRVVKEGTNSKCYCISGECRRLFKNMLSDINNPHVLGLNANEIFFLEDKVILVEGQEDVVLFKKFAKELGKNLNGTFFGWGVGGAQKMDIFLKLFSDLGYLYVVAILDGDQKPAYEELKVKYKKYKFILLKTDDIRDKVLVKKSEKQGIADKNGKLKPEYKEYVTNIYNDINTIFEKCNY